MEDTPSLLGFLLLRFLPVGPVLVILFLLVKFLVNNIDVSFEVMWLSKLEFTQVA